MVLKSWKSHGGRCRSFAGPAGPCTVVLRHSLLYLWLCTHIICKDSGLLLRVKRGRERNRKERRRKKNKSGVRTVTDGHSCVVWSCGLWAYSCPVGAIPLDCTSSPVDTSPVGERLTAAAGDALWAEPHVHSPSVLVRRGKKRKEKVYFISTDRKSVV